MRPRGPDQVDGQIRLQARFHAASHSATGLIHYALTSSIPDEEVSVILSPLSLPELLHFVHRLLRELAVGGGSLIVEAGESTREGALVGIAAAIRDFNDRQRAGLKQARCLR